MKKILLLLVLFISIYKYSYGTTYYVSTSGNNSSNGLTQATPWLTLEYAKTHATAAGDIIALKKGDTWLLDNVLDINTGGSAGTYIIWDGGLWGSGANAIIQANSDGGNAPKYYSLVHIAACKYLTLQNITFNVNNKNRCGIVIGASNAMYGPTSQSNESYITIQDCSILNSGKTDGTWVIGLGVITWNTNISNLTIQRNTINGTDNHGIAFYNGRTDNTAPSPPKELLNVYCGYNTITNIGRNNDGVYAGILVNNKITGITVEHNTITTGTGYGFGIAVSSNEPILGYFPTGVVIRYNDVRTTRPALWIENGQAKSINVYYNKFYSVGASESAVTIRTSSSPTWAGAVINFYNNTMVSSSTGAGTFSNDANTASICNFKNNIVINTSTSGYGCVKLYLSTSTIHSNNSYYRNQTGDLLYHVVSNPYAEYKRSTAQAWEPTSIITDPKLTDLSGSDFKLQAGSALINAGTDVGLLTDKEGVAISGLPDIGAYESGSASATPVQVAPPVYQSSVVENATPTLLELTYDISLSTATVPPVSSFSIIVNGVARAVSTVSISSNKIQLNLASAIKYGDVITTTYTKPATNPLQTPDGGIAASFSARATTNNLAAVIKDAAPVTLSMTISPNHIYKIIYVLLAYSSPLTTTQTTAFTPQILRVADIYGRLCVEKVLVTGTTSIRLPINLRSGTYNVLILANGAQMAAKRIRVY